MIPPMVVQALHTSEADQKAGEEAAAAQPEATGAGDSGSEKPSVARPETGLGDRHTGAIASVISASAEPPGETWCVVLRQVYTGYGVGLVAVSLQAAAHNFDLHAKAVEGLWA